MQRLAFLGGAFDPVHSGHIGLALTAQELLGLDGVEFIPNAAPPHKNGSHLSFEHRTALLEEALSPYGSLKVNTMERDALTRHYTYDTLQELRAQKGREACLYFIMGMDSLVALDTWHEGLHLTDFCNLLVFSRPGFALKEASQEVLNLLDEQAYALDDKGDPRLEVLQYKKELDRPQGRIFISHQKEVDVSSTDLRRQLTDYYQKHDEESLRHMQSLMPAGVIKTIVANHWYQESA